MKFLSSSANHIIVELGFLLSRTHFLLYSYLPKVKMLPSTRINIWIGTSTRINIWIRTPQSVLFISYISALYYIGLLYRIQEAFVKWLGENLLSPFCLTFFFFFCCLECASSWLKRQDLWNISSNYVMSRQ